MTETNVGPVTFDNVRDALGNQNPDSTNAGALRRALGRGSLSTIQKHLDTLRVQAAQPAVVVEGEVPQAPPELVQSLWAHAWVQAQEMVKTALSAALAKADALGQALGVAQQDAQAAQQEADQARDDMMAVITRLASLEGDHKAAQEAAEHAHAMQVSELTKQAVDATHQADQARSDLAVATARYGADLAILRSELDRQVSVMADLRAALRPE